MFGSEQTAEDALQEVWLDAFRGLSKLIEPGAFPGEADHLPMAESGVWHRRGALRLAIHPPRDDANGSGWS